MHRNDHVLVTGGAGFIGSHLVERLLAAEQTVTVIDDFSTGNRANLFAVADHPRLRVIESKVSAYGDLDRLAQEAGFIFHLAAAVGVDLVVKSPIHTIQTNLRETEAVLEAACASGTPVLITSTSEVYGKSQKPEFSEADDLIIGPPHLGRWSYACSKLMDEFLAMAYAKEKELPITIVRLFNTVGPRQVGHYGMVLPRFIAAARRDEPLRVFGDGRQARCFCYVQDTIEALMRLRAAAAARDEVFNVGGTEEISIGDLAALVIRTLGSASKIAFVPYGEAYAPGFEDMQRRRPLVDKLFESTEFRPQTPLQKIIELTAAAL